MEASAKTTTAFIDNRTWYFCHHVETCASFQRLPRPTASPPPTIGRPPQHQAAQEETMHTSGSPDCYMQAQMRMLRHETATAQQQLQFYQAQHPTTAIPDDLSPTKEDKEDTEPEDDNRMETLPYQKDELDSDDEETTNPLDQPTYDLIIPLPYGREAPPPDDSTPVATEALFQVAQDALIEFFATLPNNLWRGAATAEEDTTTPAQSEPAAAKSVPIDPLQISPTIVALSMLAYGNPPPPIPTEGQTQISPDSSSHTPLRLVVISESKGEYDDDSEVSDTNEEEATALDGALLEEDDDDYRSEDDANTTCTATPRAEDPYDIQGPRATPVATTPTGPSHKHYIH